MSKKPNLFILGAPKCGTTTLHNWLYQTKDVYTPISKEPHYFCEDYRLTDAATYEESYRDLKSYKYALDASVWYFYHKSWREILKYNPKSKFIVLLRNPLMMMQSMHSQEIFNGNELEVRFKRALELNDLRYKGQSIKVKNGYNSQHLAYVDSCCLDENLEEFLNEVPVKNRLVFTLDDLKSEKVVWMKICDFLNIDFVEIKFNVFNRRRVRRFVLLDKLVLFLVSAKKHIGLNRRLRILSRIRRLNSKSIQSGYKEKIELDNNVKIRINKCVKNYEALLKVNLDDWYC